MYVKYELTTLQFADHVDLIAESHTELQNVTDRMDFSSKRHGLRIICSRQMAPQFEKDNYRFRSAT